MCPALTSKQGGVGQGQAACPTEDRLQDPLAWTLGGRRQECWGFTTNSQSLRRWAVCSVEASSGFVVLGASASTHMTLLRSEKEPKRPPWLLCKPQVGSVGGQVPSFPRFLPSCSQSPASIPSPFCTCWGRMCSWGAHTKAQKHGEPELTEKPKVALGGGGRGGREAIRRIMKRKHAELPGEPAANNSVLLTTKVRDRDKGTEKWRKTG